MLKSGRPGNFAEMSTLSPYNREREKLQSAEVVHRAHLCFGIKQ
jgi:hypothetical protein